MKIAVVHDYFTQQGGAEKVAEEMYRMADGASLVSTVGIRNKMPPSLRDVPMQTSWMQSIPGIQKHYRLFFMLYPLAVRSLDLSQYDLVLSSSSGYAKGVQTRPDALHVCYCHTPMRWVWNFDGYSEREGMSAAGRKVLGLMVRGLRHWDESASRQPDHFVANSKTVAKRIRDVYHRVAEVINPPIDVDRFRVSDQQDDYYILLSRLIGYKRLDLAIEACSKLNRKLLVIGDGPYRERLMAMAGPSVQFMGRLSDSDVNHYVSRCRALIFPGEEDFGMAPLEVAAAGRPCIAYRAGGAEETIVDGRTGLFFDTQDPEDLMSAILRFEKQTWGTDELREHAEGFRTEVFQERMRTFLKRVGCPLPASTLPFRTQRPFSESGKVAAIAQDVRSAS